MVVLIPGIGGSRLERNGKLVYDLSLGSVSQLLSGGNHEQLKYQGSCDEVPDDGIVATDLINKQMIPGLFGIDDFDGIRNVLRASVNKPEQQFVKFPYDWRVSNRITAERLDAFIRPKLDAWRQQSGAADAKLWLVCHSMGGLVARYFLEHLDGKSITRHLITIGTPHRGAPKALGALVNGHSFFLSDFGDVLRTFPAMYELLPLGRIVRTGGGDIPPLARLADFFGLSDVLPQPPGPALAVPAGLTPLTGLDPEWLRRSLEFHADIRRPVITRMQEGRIAPYTQRHLINRRQPTLQSALWVNGHLSMLNEPPTPVAAGVNPQLQRGDGTVPAFAAVPIEDTDISQAIIVDESHVKLPSAKGVTDIIQNFLDPINAGLELMGADSNGSFGVNLPSVARANTEFQIEVDVIKAAQVRAAVKALNGQVIAQAVQRVADGQSRGFAFKLAAGTYEIVVNSAADPSRPSSSHYLVVVD
jgi:pimeloyl-ACP methyl ester carboxylesterase